MSPEAEIQNIRDIATFECSITHSTRFIPLKTFLAPGLLVKLVSSKLKIFTVACFLTSPWHFQKIL